MLWQQPTRWKAKGKMLNQVQHDGHLLSTYAQIQIQYRQSAIQQIFFGDTPNL
jgi:hypothetical protein